MKKFIFWLIFLIILGGTIFYFGWVRIPENSMGLGFSGVTGYDKEFMRPGQLNWRWQKLIPKNYSISTYTLEMQNTDIVVSNELPSGKIYSQILPGNPDFSYSVQYVVSYSLDEQTLYTMATSGQISDANLSAFYKETNKKIQNIGESALLNIVDDATSGENTTFDQQNFEEKLAKVIAESIPEVKFSRISVVSSVFPDLELYKTGKKQYLELLAMKSTYTAEQEKKNADYTSEIEKRIEVLRKYGELLTKFPILIEYLKTQNEQLLPENITPEDLKALN
ncbi:MAG: hypothetical protein MJ215_06160 [Spirochaetia bacterium]|nr:hypothetical protein [Spirochaetia bacterium]